MIEKSVLLGFRRKHVRKYALMGFIRCEKCGKALYAQIQHEKYTYYCHPNSKEESCQALRSIPLKIIERAVFETILENDYDEVGFQFLVLIPGT